MKRGLLGFPLLIFLSQVVSAQFFGGYGGFSITNFFDSIDSATMTLGLLFFIFFALIFYASAKIFKNPYGEPNKGIAGTIAFAVSLLIIYGIHRAGFNLGDLLYIPSGFIPIIILALAILVIWGLGRKKEFGRKSFSLKRGLGGFFMLLGLLLILLATLTDIFYEKLTALIIGVFLLLVGILLLKKRKRKLTGYDDYGPSPRGPGTFGRMRERRRDIRDVKHEQKLDYERQKAEEKYQRKLHGAEVTRRAKKIAKIRGRREKIRERKEKPERKRQGEFRRAEKAAYREDAKRQKEMQRQQAEQNRKQQAQGEIQQINNEITRLRQMIPGASVIERGKIEDQIRAYEKKAKKLGKFL